MNINFQSDDLGNNSNRSYSSTFSSDIDDIPTLNDENSSNYNTKNVEKKLSNQFHDLIIGEIASAHLGTLQTTFAGFQQNTELEGGLKHKSRNEVAIESTKNIMPQLEQYLFEYLDLSIENAVGLSAKNYGEDFVKNKNSDEEEEDKIIEEEEEIENDNDEYDNDTIVDQEITLNEDKNEEKKHSFLNSVKSFFNKPKENETNSNENSSNSLNDSTSWWPKANIKQSKSVGPKSVFFKNSSFTDDNNTENEEKSTKKKIFNSFPFLKAKNNSNDSSIENNEIQGISKNNSSPKISFKNIFSKQKENNENKEKPNNKPQRTVRFADLNDESNQNQSQDSNLNTDSNFQSIQPDNNSNIIEQPKPIAVEVENINDFSSASDSKSESDSPRCRTPDSNPEIEADIFEVQSEDQESEEEIVKSLIRPPTPEKESSIEFSSEPESSDQNSKKETNFDFDYNSESNLKSEINNNNNNNNNSVNSSFQSNESKSIKDQDLLLSASESESETASSMNRNDRQANNKSNKGQIDKKAKSNLFNFHLSSSSSSSVIDENLDKKIESDSHQISIKAKNVIIYKNNEQTNSNQIQNNNNDEKMSDQKSTEKVLKNDRVDILKNITNNGKNTDEYDSIKTSGSNVDFIANELSDFQLNHRTFKNESTQLNSEQIKSQDRLSNTYDSNNKNNRYLRSNMVKKEPLKNSDQPSQTKLQRRKQNIIQVNTYFEVPDEKVSSVKKRIKKKKVEIISDDEEEEVEIEINRRKITQKRKVLYSSNSNSSSPNSPKGRSSNSSSPHPYSPVHTHTHTPVPVKPRLILKNSSSSDDEDEDEQKLKKIKRNSKRSESVTPKSSKTSKSSTISTPKARNLRNSPEPKNSPMSTATLSSSPNVKATTQPAIRKKKKQIKSRNENEFDKNEFQKVKDDRETEKVAQSPSLQTKKVPKRRKRASSEKRPLRIKSRNPQLSIASTKNENENFEETPKSNRKSTSTTSSPTKTKRKNLNQNHQRQQSLSSTLPRSYPKISDDDDDNDDQISVKSHRPRSTKFESAKSGPVKRIRRSNSSELSHSKRRVTTTTNNDDNDDDNNSSLTSIKTGRIQTVNNQKRPRRLSVDQAILDRKALAKSGVRSIILIEFDKKTPLIENFLEQISSNPGSLSQSLPKRRGRSKRSTQSDVIITRGSRSGSDDDYDDDLSEETAKTVNYNGVSNRARVRPKITKRSRSRMSAKKKEAVVIIGSDSDNENDFSSDDQKALKMLKNENDTDSSAKSSSRKRRRQNSVKPSSLNRTSEPQSKNLKLNEKEIRLSKTVRETEMKSESESVIVNSPLKKLKTNKRKRMESVKSDMTLKRSYDENEDYHSYRFNFKKLFDEAERNEKK